MTLDFMERIGEDFQAISPIPIPEHQQIIDLEQQIRGEIENLPTITTNPCIFQIPQHIRSISPAAYTPFRVPIGPYHADKEHLKSMESHKLRYFDSLLWRSGDQNKLKDCIAEIEKSESEARKCYSGIEGLDSQKLKRMLLLDGAFILEFFIKRFDENGNKIDFSNESNTESNSFRADIRDPIFDNGSVRIEVVRDLILLENQLPFFILQALFDCLLSSKNPSITLPSLAYECLCDLIPTRSNKAPSLEVQERTNKMSVMHLTHLIRMCCLNVPKGDPSKRTSLHSLSMKHCCLNSSCTCPTELKFGCLYLKLNDCWGRKKKELENDQIRHNISATELCEAGVHFKMVETGQFIDINFDEDKGVLEMPFLRLDDGTETFFRNIMAFEQYHLNEDDFTNYMFFMDGLIDIPKDVHILERRRLLDNWLESKEDATTLFNSITKQAAGAWKYRLLSKKLTIYVTKPWNKWKAMLRRDYFGSPWAIISFIAAVVLLCLTFVQTIASFRSIK